MHGWAMEGLTMKTKQNLHSYNVDDDDIHRSMEFSFRKTQHILKSLTRDRGKTGIDANGSGTTVTIGLLMCEKNHFDDSNNFVPRVKLHCAHVGDSRAVLARSGVKKSYNIEAVDLTDDHKYKYFLNFCKFCFYKFCFRKFFKNIKIL